MAARKALHAALDRIDLPDKGRVAITREHLADFFEVCIEADTIEEFVERLRPYRDRLHFDPEWVAENPDGFIVPGEPGRLKYTIPPVADVKEMIRREWECKIDVKGLNPGMDAKEVRAALVPAAANTRIRALVAMWETIAEGGGPRLKLTRDDEGRKLRVTGLRPLAAGWSGVTTIIASATANAVLLQPIWPSLREERILPGWTQLRMPPNVRITQLVDRALSKWSIGISGEPEARDREVRAVREVWAAVLTHAARYGGAKVGVVLYKSTREFVEKHCFVPEWMTLTHFGDVDGTDELRDVRALFVVGRPMPQALDLAEIAEALFNEPVVDREFKMVEKVGRIWIHPDPQGRNCIRVDDWRSADWRVEALRRSVTEAALIQAVGRARAALRGPDEPLDIHLWTNVGLPELGQVDPVPWDEIEVESDGLMLAAGGMWLDNVADAVKVLAGDPGLPELFKADALEMARRRNQNAFEDRLFGQGAIPPAPFKLLRYQKKGAGQKWWRLVAFEPANRVKRLVEKRLGPLQWKD
jgi:hypothetical protein